MFNKKGSKIVGSVVIILACIAVGALFYNNSGIAIACVLAVAILSYFFNK